MAKQDTPQTGTRSNGIGADVLRYLENHPGVTIYLSDLASELPQYQEHKIRDTVNSLRYRDVGGSALNIKTVAAGKAWRWQPNTVTENPNADETLYRKRMTTASGTVIVESEDGKLYSIRELDI